jgi:threonine dehydratase
MNFTREQVQAAQRTVYAAMPPTPQYAWPLLQQRLGFKVWVKHENHTPAGAFKVRGGLTYFEQLGQVKGVISATRGNHGQSVGFAARRYGIPATIVVPHGNSLEKNAAMRALGVTLIEHGEDFQAAREHAIQPGATQGLHMVPSFHPELIRGVMTYWVEFFESFARARRRTWCLCRWAWARASARRPPRGHTPASRPKLVGVVSAHATMYQDSFRARRAIESPVTTVLADGMACRVPEPGALDALLREADDVVAVTDDEVAEAMRVLFADTHNVAEGAGAASLAAAMQQRERLQGQVVGTTLCGGNVDSAVFARVLVGQRVARQVLQHRMLVACLHTLGLRHVGKFARCIKGDTKRVLQRCERQRWQAKQLNRADDLLEARTPFLADAIAPECIGQPFVARLGRGANQAVQTFAWQQYTRVGDLDTIVINFDHGARTRDGEILMNQRIRNQLAQGNFRVNRHLGTQSLLNDFRVGQGSLEVAHQPFKRHRVALVLAKLVNRLHLVGAPVADNTNALA